MGIKKIGVLTASLILGVAMIAFAQASNKNESELLAQIEKNEAQISELKEKIEALESRLGNVEVGLGNTQSQLEWKVQPLASDTK
ncbi:hypothetical protein ACNKU7_18625 [Microbulbifer sp. SA54]|uniref:hypothetical protein n=1 Tax=Microbulbifer sp. SA54 TaxID=3401577 RepID=UPI003AAEFB18